MLTAARRGDRLLQEDTGFTLVELLVTMIIASIIGALALSWFLGVSNATTTTTNADNATASARNVLQSWSRMLQLGGAPATAGGTTNGVVKLSSTSISFTAYLSNSGGCGADTSCTPLASSTVTLGLIDAIHSDSGLSACTHASSGELVEILGGNCSIDESSTTSATDPSGCLFTAYTAAGPLGCSSSLTSAQLAAITSVVLAFKVTTTDGHTRSFQTTAAFSN